MSLLTAKLRPGIVERIPVLNGTETRLVAGVDYTTAKIIFASKSADGRDFRLDETGTITDLDEVEYFGLLGGQAKLSSRHIERDSPCMQHVAVVVDNPDEWVWAKLKIQGSRLGDYACLAINHATAEAFAVSLEDMC